MEPLVSCRKDLAPGRAIAALPVGDHTARALDNGNKCGDVPSVECRFDNQIDEPHGQRRKQITIPAPAAHTHMLLDGAERGLLVWGKVSGRMCRTQDRAFERLAPPRGEYRFPAPLTQRRAPVHTSEPLAQNRLIDDSEDRSSPVFKCNERTPFVPARDEAACSIHR